MAETLAKPRILLVDDDPSIVRIVQAYLEKDGYRVLTSDDGLQALDLARQRQPDLLVLDLMLPQMDGLDVCRVLRGEGNKVPIIMLTAKTTEQDRLTGLDLGADDYVTKPFSPRELLARVRAVLRRANEAADAADELRSGDLVVDTVGHQARLRGQPLALTPVEFKLLTVLMERPGKAFTRLELLDLVFGYEYEGLERTIDVHVMNLRRKIEPCPEKPIYVETVYGVGYRFPLDNHAS